MTQNYSKPYQMLHKMSNFSRFANRLPGFFRANFSTNYTFNRFSDSCWPSRCYKSRCLCSRCMHSRIRRVLKSLAFDVLARSTHSFNGLVCKRVFIAMAATKQHAIDPVFISAFCMASKSSKTMLRLKWR